MEDIIKITEKAAAYIRSKSGSIYLVETQPVMLFWCRASLGPSVRLGIPHEPEKYALYLVNGIDVFVPRRLYIPRAFTIGLNNYILFKALSVEDWKLI